jgi:hypothetical protein
MLAASNKIPFSKARIKLQKSLETPIALWMIAVRTIIDNASGKL